LDGAGSPDLKTIGESAGIDLINQPAEARNWVMEVLRKNMKAGHSVTVGNYCYLDSDKHVKVSIAMDVISEAVATEYARALHPQPLPPSHNRFAGSRSAPPSPTFAPRRTPTSSAEKLTKPKRRTRPTLPGTALLLLLRCAVASCRFDETFVWAGTRSC
jgi:hypothetical protein